MQNAHIESHLGPASPTPAPVAPSPEPWSAAAPERRTAQIALGGAIVAGVATQALFWGAPAGLNWWLWDLMVIGLQLAAFRRKMTPAAWGAVAAAAVLGASVVGFASDWTLWVAIPSTFGVLAALPIVLGDELTVAKLASLPARWLASLGHAPKAVREAARLPGEALGGATGGVAGSVAKGTLLGLPTAGFFALLLSSDVGFASMLGWVRLRATEGVSFAFWSAVSAAIYAVVHAMHRRARPRAGSDAAPPARGPYRVPPLWAPAPGRALVTPAAWGTVLGQVAVVFAGFAAVNAKTLFGGHAIVRAAGGPTYASYLHSGFAQLLFATVLSVCLVLAGHAWMRRRAPEAMSGPAPGGRALAAIEATLLVLTFVALASCWQRLAIYEDAYGATYLRLGVGFVELAVAGTLVLTVAKSLKRSWRGHAGAVMVMLTLVAVAAATMNADATIAERNLDRALNERGLDLDYLLTLSTDACAALDHPALAADPKLRDELVRGWTANTPSYGWRSARGINRCGR